MEGTTAKEPVPDTRENGEGLPQEPTLEPPYCP
jgi:hypothetical protein